MPCSTTPVGPSRQAGTARWCGLPPSEKRRLPRVAFGAQSHGLSARCLRFAPTVARRYARLASGRRPAFTGRDCPAGLNTRFHLHASSSTQLSWRTLTLSFITYDEATPTLPRRGSGRPAGRPAGPPRIRTCRFPASGSSAHGFAEDSIDTLDTYGMGWSARMRANVCHHMRARCERRLSHRRHIPMRRNRYMRTALSFPMRL
jgi:hypothetical protein